MTKTTDPVILYKLTLRREVPITGTDGQPTGEVKHFVETHTGCTYEQALAIRAKAAHVKDAMIDKAGVGKPGAIVSKTDIGSPVNMQAPAGPRKPRPAYVPLDTSKWGKPPQRAREARETPAPKREAPTPRMRDYADLVNVMAEEERA